MAYLSLNSKGGRIISFNSTVLPDFVFNENYILAHTSDIAMHTYRYLCREIAGISASYSKTHSASLRRRAKKSATIPVQALSFSRNRSKCRSKKATCSFNVTITPTFSKRNWDRASASL
jgi:hypothetical protein